MQNWGKIGNFLLHFLAQSNKTTPRKLFVVYKLSAMILPHPPYSPDLAPSDLFPNLKKSIKDMKTLKMRFMLWKSGFKRKMTRFTLKDF